MAKHLAQKFEILGATDLDLASLATVIELRYSRRALVAAIADRLHSLQPIRGVLNLPDFHWAGLYTTNYDELIEKSYRIRHKPLQVVASNFDFGADRDATQQCLYKLHGTIDQDTSLGHKHRLIVTTTDYDQTASYRELLYAKFTEQLYSNDALIVGQSLSDPDLQSIVNDAIRCKREKGAPGKITLFSFEPDENLAIVFEARGLNVCFGGIDRLFSEITTETTFEFSPPDPTDNPIDTAPSVHPSTVTVSSLRSNQTANLSSMFNGSPASYADIWQGYTFDRDFADRLETQFADADAKRIAYVIGPAGSGKTTGARKALVQLVDRGIECWEHVNDFSFPAPAWIQIDDELRKRRSTGVLLIDDAHRHLHEVNSLIDAICNAESLALRVILISSRPNWNPRLKSAGIFSQGQSYELAQLSNREINSLLDILETSSEIAALVEDRFLGFSRNERQWRLADRCRADMFVCMKNIFASESFDDIILREYAELLPDYQQAYRQIAAMESAGVRVHRQLVIRTVEIQASRVSRYLSDLEGIIEEHTVSEREGVFTWHVRHGVIADIIAKYKFAGDGERFALLERIIDNLNPSYRIEIESMNEICDYQRGLAWIYDKRKQNILLRKMISLAPRQRVPRHRLITNLISLGDYTSATTEIRLFENQLRRDGPVQRYKVRLLLERARRTKGILQEDRAAMVLEAAKLADAGVKRFPEDKNMYRVYLEAGMFYLRYGDSRNIFDNAMESAKSAYSRILDPDLARTIRRFEGMVGP